MKILQNICIKLPATTAAQSAAFKGLSDLFIAGTASQNKSDLLPQILLQESRSQMASISFGSDCEIRFNTSRSADSADRTSSIPIEEICKKFHAYITLLDHAGINICSNSLSNTSEVPILETLGASSALYAYPGGEPWFFVVPATEQEQRSSISDFSVLRCPKFEIVAETIGSAPLIQLDFATKLSRAEVEQRLPAPFGIGLPGLEQYFRSVYVTHPWQGFDIRMDFRYADDLLNIWSSGQWLITEGKRVFQA